MALDAIPDGDELDTILRDLQCLDCSDGDEGEGEPGCLSSAVAAAPAERDDERPARAVASESERARVDSRLLDTFPPGMPLRTSQAWHLASFFLVVRAFLPFDELLASEL